MRKTLEAAYEVLEALAFNNYQWFDERELKHVARSNGA